MIILLYCLAHVYCFVCLSSCASVVSIVRLLPFLFFDGQNLFLTLYIYCSVLLCLILFSGIFYQALSLYPSLPFVPCPPPSVSAVSSFPALPLFLSKFSLLFQATAPSIPGFPSFPGPPVPAVLSFPGLPPPCILGFPSFLAPFPPLYSRCPYFPSPPHPLYPSSPFFPSSPLSLYLYPASLPPSIPASSLYPSPPVLSSNPVSQRPISVFHASWLLKLNLSIIGISSWWLCCCVSGSM